MSRGPRQALRVLVALSWLTISAPGCDQVDRLMADPGTPMACIFVGVDVSGSFMRSKNFDDGLEFLSQYLYARLKGLGGLERPHSLFVGTIGGTKAGEPKTFFPIQTFENSTAPEIHAKLKELFPKNKENPFTDFNAFFEQVSTLVKNKRLILKPLTIVLLSDGKPDMPGKQGDERFRAIDIRPLENLSRNVTIRLLYTDAVTGQSWVTKVPRRRIKFWTQDAEVMAAWKDPKIFLTGAAIESQERYFSWIKDNVDFPARLMRVD
ncbi:MAG TPA: hypothetical protein VM598_04770 [Bdellovibrionota bacterium]|nr:hypothetical protein [Bdellovibrionota bacterium]